VSISTNGVALLWLLVACRGPQPDACERAFARLDRINGALASKLPRSFLEECRHGRFASYDPVLRCAMDSESDATAAVCIDRIVKDVLRPSPGSEGSGINPLLDER
jgi:hypothetical protein